LQTCSGKTKTALDEVIFSSSALCDTKLVCVSAIRLLFIARVVCELAAHSVLQVKFLSKTVIIKISGSFLMGSCSQVLMKG